MSDREVLEAALAQYHKGRPIAWADVLEVAALERLAQLAEKCGTCDGEGHYVVASTRGQWATDDLTCPTCQGSAKVYPYELVGRVAMATAAGSHWDAEHTAAAHRVLNALNSQPSRETL